MTNELPLRCQCGQVRGSADVSGPGMRAVCMCDDCQTFARFLDRPDVLDAHGGSDIYQMSPARITLREGKEQLRAMRLSPKGLIRFYTACCRTPIGNTVSGKMPFIGTLHSIVDHAGDGRTRDEALGPPKHVIMGKFARGGMPKGAHAGFPLRAFPSIAGLLARNWLNDRNRPNPFFDAKTKQPVVEPRVLTKAERDALR